MTEPGANMKATLARQAAARKKARHQQAKQKETIANKELEKTRQAHLNQVRLRNEFYSRHPELTQPEENE